MRIVLIIALFLQFTPLEVSAQYLKNEPVDGFTYDYGRWPYPLNEEVGVRLKELADKYPDIARIHNLGKTRRGKDLWVMEISNIKTGPGTTKPGLWMDGNIHAGELTGRQYLHYFIERMLYSYGKDDNVTRLIDTRTFYIMPVFDADGGDMLLSRHPAWPGHNPSDIPGKDLNGDGYITQMRVKDDSDENGYRYYLESPEVKTGFFSSFPPFLNRKMRNRVTGEREGADFNRNWSAGWRPQEPGAGSRPYSLPEVAAVADFIEEFNNIYFTYTIHSGGGSRSYMVRPPMNEPYETMPPEDNHFYVRSGAVWSYLSDGGIMENNYYSFLFNTSEINPETGEQYGYRDTMYGFMDDWAYMQAGIHSITPEVNGSAPDYNNDGWIREDEIDKWHWEEKDGQYFSPWTPYNHPALGNVEIGGERGIPPAVDGTLKMHCEQQFDYLLYIADLSPLLRIADVSVEEVSRREYRITAYVRNDGWLSTYVTQRAIEIKRDLPAVAEIEIKGGELIDDESLKQIGHIKGKLVYIRSWGGGDDQSTESVSWAVRASGSGPIEATIKAWAPKAGRDIQTLTIDQ